MGPLLLQLFNKIVLLWGWKYSIVKVSWDVDMYPKTHAGSQALSFQPIMRGGHRGALPGPTVASRISEVKLILVIVPYHIAECGLSLQTLHFLDVFSFKSSSSGALVTGAGGALMNICCFHGINAHTMVTFKLTMRSHWTGVGKRGVQGPALIGRKQTSTPLYFPSPCATDSVSNQKSPCVSINSGYRHQVLPGCLPASM